MQLILEAEGWVVSVLHRKCLLCRCVALWASILKHQQPQVRCGALKGVEGVLVGDVNKEPEVRRQNNSLEGAKVMLEAEGWVMVNKKPAADKHP